MRGSTVDEIIKKFSLNSKKAISNCIINTIKGNFWFPGYSQGGRSPFISEVDLIGFKKRVSQAARDLTCLNTKEALYFALEIREVRYKRGCFLAEKCKQKEKMPKSYQETLERLKPVIPSEEWLGHFCKANDIFLKKQK